MTYVVVKKVPMNIHQMTIQELLGMVPVRQGVYCVSDDTSTRTLEITKRSTMKYYNRLINVDHLISVLRDFNNKTAKLHDVDRHSLYREFYIPKKSRGYRKIDAPNAELMEALRELKRIFEEDFHALYHTSAFAYIKKRCHLDAVKKHQVNQSNWYAKFDLSNFFGSTTKEFVISMFSRIFPFSEVLNTGVGYEEFEKAIDLAFLDGGLPQGTPISPIITNVMMIPIDYSFANHFRKFVYINKEGEVMERNLIYTRYADDMIISSRQDFDFKVVERHIEAIFQLYKAPFHINSEKTRYGSRAGSNFNLGVMVNKDNKITIGYKKKREFRNSLFSYAKNKIDGTPWDIEDVRVLEGLRNYYHNVEGEDIDNLVQFVSNKVGINIMKEIKNDLRG